jgi:heme exporter protein CcmD
MDFSAAHTGYVIVSYALSAFCLVGLCAYIFRQDRNLAKQLKTLNESSKP